MPNNERGTNWDACQYALNLNGYKVYDHVYIELKDGSHILFRNAGLDTYSDCAGILWYIISSKIYGHLTFASDTVKFTRASS